MGDRFKDKYRTTSDRLRNWDYGRNGLYFITLCTRKFDYYFGEIESGKIKLSEVGKISSCSWFEMPNHFTFIKLDAFAVMPNHIHGIIIIDKHKQSKDPDHKRDEVYSREYVCSDNDLCSRDDLFSRADVVCSRDAINRVSTEGSMNADGVMKKTGGITGNNNPMLNDNLGRIIRWYKGRVSFESHKINLCFDWQPGFYDHIIRDEQEYANISNYIINNPVNWHGDKFLKKP